MTFVRCLGWLTFSHAGSTTSFREEGGLFRNQPGLFLFLRLTKILSVEAPTPFNGEKIKRLIKESGYTQASFSELISVSELNLRKMIHNGVYDLRTLFKIAKALKIDVCELIAPFSNRNE